MRSYKTAALGLIALFISVSASANQPDSFRGHKWGSDISEFPRTQLVASDGESKWYRIIGDKLSIGDAPLSSLSYGFYNNKLYTVAIYFSGGAYHKIKETLFQTFEKGFKPIDSWSAIGGDQRSRQLLLEFSEISDEGFILYSYKPIGDMKHEDDKIAARKAAKDL